MDFNIKGISWVGNVYQKFEAMCLEVEDVMCQETAKYVEAQVQTVGSSVKKFYAEVLQDLSPPSSLDPKKSEGSGLFLEQDAAFGSYEKPKPSGEVPVKEKLFSHDTLEITIPATKSSLQEQRNELDNCKRSKAGGNEYPTNKRPLPVEMSDVINCSGKKLSQVSLRSRAQNKNHLLPSQSISPVMGADLRLPQEHNDNGEARGNTETQTELGSRANLPLLDALQPVATVREGSSPASSFSSCLKEDHHKAFATPERLTSPTSFDLPVCDSFKTTGISCSGRVIEIGCAPDTSSSIQSSLAAPVISCENKGLENGFFAVDDISTETNVVGSAATSYTLPLQSSCTEPGKFSEEKSDDDHAGLEQGDDIVELAPEAIAEFQNGKLEESCIVVDRKELPFLPHQEGKNRSYKKKIRDALRMRLAKKQEYEQLAIWHEDVNNPSNIESSSPSLPTGDMKSSSQDIGESEWELL